MKTLYSILLCGLFCAATMTANAQTWNCGYPNAADVKATLDANGVMTISGTGAMANYFNGATPWYSLRNQIKEGIIEIGVTSIGAYAFRGCTSLTEVTIPNSVTTIKAWAFYQCTSLTEVTIPNSLTTIERVAFLDNTSLTAFNVDADNPNYSSAEGVLFNKDKTKLTLYAIGKPQTSYTIPNSVTAIGVYAFNGCTSLTEVTIPNSVTYIGEGAFVDCTSLTAVTIPKSVTEIQLNAFNNCTSLTTVTIPNPVPFMGSYVFYNCTSLTELINHAETPRAIKADVFQNVNKTACTLQVPAASVELYKAAAVWKDFGNIEAIPAAQTWNCGYPNAADVKATLDANGVMTISGTGAMADYSASTSVPWYSLRNQIKELIIEPGVTTIGNVTFYSCSSLTSLTIPNSVATIGRYTFRSCTSLTSLTIPNSVTTIGVNAFENCPSLTAVTIPNSVTTIGFAAFRSCSSLTAVAIPNSLTTIGEDAFTSCTSLTAVTIPNSENNKIFKLTD